MDVVWSKLTAGLGLLRCPSLPDGGVMSGRKHVGPEERVCCGDDRLEKGFVHRLAQERRIDQSPRQDYTGYRI